MITDSFLDNAPKRQTAFRCAENVPCFGAMYITDSEVVADGIVYTTRKWADGDVKHPSRIIFNTGTTYIAGEVGTCSQIFPLQARVNGAWSITSKLGMVAGSWDLHVDEGVELFIGLAPDTTEAYYDSDTLRSIWVNVSHPQRRPDLTGIVTAGAGTFREPTGAGPFTVSDVSGIEEIYEGPSEIEGVENPLDKKLWVGTDTYQPKDCRVWMKWNVTSETYQIYSATENRVVHSVNREDCEFLENDGEEGEHTWERGHEANWIQSITQDECALVYTDACGEEWPLLDLSQFVQSIYWDGTCLRVYRCGESLAGTVIVCGAPCEEATPDCTGQYTRYRAEFVSGVPAWVVLTNNCTTCSTGTGPTPAPTEKDAERGITIDIPCVPP